MSKEILKAKNLKMAIAALPEPKLYGAALIKIPVGKLWYTFVKDSDGDWEYKMNL